MRCANLFKDKKVVAEVVLCVVVDEESPLLKGSCEEGEVVLQHISFITVCITKRKTLLKRR